MFFSDVTRNLNWEFKLEILSILKDEMGFKYKNF